MRQFGKTIEEAKSRVPSAQDRLNMLQEYEVPETLPDAEATILQIRHKYNEVMRYSLINRIKTLRALFTKPPASRLPGFDCYHSGGTENSCRP